MISGLLNLFWGQFEIAAGWIIFGSMYLVMEDYAPIPSSASHAKKQKRVLRITFGWVGVVFSFLLLLYYLFM